MKNEGLKMTFSASHKTLEKMTGEIYNPVYADRNQMTQEILRGNKSSDLSKPNKVSQGRKSLTIQTKRPTRNFKTFIRSPSVAVELPKANSQETLSRTRKEIQKRADNQGNKDVAGRGIQQTIPPQFESYMSDITNDDRTTSRYESDTITSIIPLVKLKQVKAAHRQLNADQKRFRLQNALAHDDFENRCYEIEDLYARCKYIRPTKSVKRYGVCWE